MRAFKSSPFCLYSGKMPWSHTADSGILPWGRAREGKTTWIQGDSSNSTLQGVSKNPCGISWAWLCPLLHIGVTLVRIGLFNLQHSIHYQVLKKIYIFSLSLFVFFSLQLISISRPFPCCLLYSLTQIINCLCEIREPFWICTSSVFVSLNVSCPGDIMLCFLWVFFPVFCKWDMFYFHCWKAIWVRTDTKTHISLHSFQTWLCGVFFNSKFI